MKVFIYDSICTGCAACSDLASDIFGLNDDKIAFVKKPDADVPENRMNIVKQAIDDCPVECIELED